MKIGYARCSTKDQNLDLQTDALTKAGCDIIYREEGVSGSRRSRPQLDICLASLNRGDVLCVWRMDRASRSLSHLISMIEDFKTRGIQFESLCERIDTTSAVGNLIFNIFGSFAQFEREVIRERVTAGMHAAMSRGKKMGRKAKYADEEIVKGSVSKATYYRRRK